MSVVIPVILCGGSGTRLWPLSRSDRPKQLVSIGGNHTLLEGTLLRAKAIAGAADSICVTAAAYAAEVRQSLDRLGLRGRLLIEPEPRNTAPALCAAALVAMRSDPNAIIVALPADHVIENGEALAASIAHAVAAAEKGWLVILGVRPRHASSALGYIVPGAAVDGLPQIARVSRFVEKPEPEVAASLVSTGALWNAGIVVARADAVTAAMQKHEPAVLETVEGSFANGSSETDEIQLNQAGFVATPRISFDKAVLERHEAVAVTALDAMWRDVGTWAEVAELYPADGDGNRQSGRVQFSSSHNSFVLSPHRLTVGIGLKDLIVIDTPDALLIVSRNDLGRLREVVEEMTAAHQPEVSAGNKAAKDAGHRLRVASNDDFEAMEFRLAAGETLRRGPHHDVARHWIVVEGSVELMIGGQSSTYAANQGFYVPSGNAYQLTSRNGLPVRLIEVLVTRRPMI